MPTNWPAVIIFLFFFIFKLLMIKLKLNAKLGRTVICEVEK